MFGTDTSCIILAGGLGTRLRGSIGEMPKCMAPVAGRPFLEYLLLYLERQGIQHIVLSLGYRADVVQDWLRSREWPFAITSVVENEPLGTGGGITLAMQLCTHPTCFVVNGDTFFDVDLQDMYHAFRSDGTETTLALKHLQGFDRYGTVRTEPDAHGVGERITAFVEKQSTEDGLINGGIYCIDRDAFLARSLPTKFSFEKDYLEALVGSGIFSGYRSEGYFIDIGVPADFERAQRDFQTLFPA